MENTAEDSRRQGLTDTARPEHAEPARGARDLGDELILHEAQGGCVHVLNASAREVFLLCDGTRDLRTVSRALAECYGIEEAVARRDAETVIADLVRLGFLRLS